MTRQVTTPYMWSETTWVVLTRSPTVIFMESCPPLPSSSSSSSSRAAPLGKLHTRGAARSGTAWELARGHARAPSFARCKPVRGEGSQGVGSLVNVRPMSLIRP